MLLCKLCAVFCALVSEGFKNQISDVQALCPLNKGGPTSSWSRLDSLRETQPQDREVFISYPKGDSIPVGWNRQVNPLFLHRSSSQNTQNPEPHLPFKRTQTPCCPSRFLARYITPCPPRPSSRSTTKPPFWRVLKGTSSCQAPSVCVCVWDGLGALSQFEPASQDKPGVQATCQMLSNCQQEMLDVLHSGTDLPVMT